MTYQTIQQAISQFFAGAHIDEHTALLLCVGVVIGALLFRGGYHRRAYGYYRRWRGY
jgi:hypothetical protein